MPKGVADRDQMMQDMLAQMPAPQEQEQDPAEMVAAAIDQVNSYIDNPNEVTPETLQALKASLEQVLQALGGGNADESALPMGQGSEQMS